jgi:hypothetical protein
MENLINSIVFTAIIFFPFTMCLFAKLVIRIDKYLASKF